VQGLRHGARPPQRRQGPLGLAPGRGPGRQDPGKPRLAWAGAVELQEVLEGLGRDLPEVGHPPQGRPDLELREARAHPEAQGAGQAGGEEDSAQGRAGEALSGGA